ncbi:hypothetical protein PtA15_7A369 [Puccinia triticina]|uniref:DUF6818 domain-containing protein n=1 Tax=Puccinia triticina TaxID=208348 RepID=A0ABY7CRQ2_9BASI|nr:uncharacterized protein PtA15_7A369 [Puccinia triticina]WAQ86642.1 hypothetical protein PtA15_7A369 [Puccinia triticina]
MTQIRSSQQTQQAAQMTQQTQEASQPIEVPATTQATNTQTAARRTGRQRGSQGYNGADCSALVDCIQRVLPLGSNNWDKVHDLYKKYVIKNGQLTCDPDPLKTKFKALVALKKPTGNPNCPVWIREAKQANVMIKERAHSLPLLMKIMTKMNGVGNPVPLSLGDPCLGSNMERTNELQGTLLSGWIATQSLQANPADIEGDTSDEAVQDIVNASQSAQYSAGGIPAASLLATPHPPDNTVSRNQTVARESRGPSATPASQSTNTAPPSGPTRCSREPQPQAGLQAALTSFFDPEACEAR